MIFFTKASAVKYVFTVFIMFFGIISSFAVDATEFDLSKKTEFPFPNQEYKTEFNSVFEQITNSSVLFYSPFASNRPQSDNEQFESYMIQFIKDDMKRSDPVLYGPGGDPIGGLPIGEGVYALFFGVIAYCIYKIGCKIYYVRILNRKEDQENPLDED